MKNRTITSWLVYLLFFSLVLASRGLAQTAEPEDFNTRELTLGLKSIELQLRARELSADGLARIKEQAAGYAGEAKQCVAANELQLTKINTILETIGPSLAGESQEIAKKRKSLSTEKTALETELAECRLILLKAAEVKNEAAMRRKQVLTQMLFHRDRGLTDLLIAIEREGRIWWEGLRWYFQKESGLDRLTSGSILVLILLLAAATAFGFRQQARWRHLLARLPDRPGMNLGRAFLATGSFYLPVLAPLPVFALFLILVAGAGASIPYPAFISLGIAAFLAGMAVVRAALLPMHPAAPLHDWPLPVARLLLRRLQVVLVLLIIGFLLFATGLLAGIPVPLLLLARHLFVSFFCLALLWFVWPVKNIPGQARLGRRLRLGSPPVLGIVTAAAWLGYANLAAYLLHGLLGTLFLLLLYRGLQTLLDRLSAALSHGEYAGKEEPKAGGKGGPPEAVKSFSWLLLIIRLFLLGSLGLGLLRIWGVSERFLAAFFTSLAEGFRLGGMTFSPARILYGLLAFSLLWALSSWLKARLEQDWLKGAKLAPGAEQTLTTMVGYAGFTIAILVGLSFSGVDFTGLAVIAGALSVGIGFGLQNVVNNFVSGLILLFERPIKKGDWIVVGETQGYVQKISVRSTIIQTFDRADVIVPNSDLISGQVTNLMLNDTWGRVRIPVGVAYGSDTGLVKEVLLGVMRDHPKVIQGGEEHPEPQVLFIGFGESSLDFELRCFIQDINLILVVKSELLFAIDAAFRRHGIEIPFPQRVVHLRPSSPEGDDGVGGGRLEV